MFNKNKIEENIESLVKDMYLAVRGINELSYQPEIGLYDSFNFDFEYLVLNVQSKRRIQESNVDGSLKQKIDFKRDVDSKERRVIAKDEEIEDLAKRIQEVAILGEDYDSLVNLLGQMSVKDYKGQVKLDCTIDVKKILSDIEFMKNLTSNFYRAKDNKEEWNQINSYLHDLSDKYNSRKIRLPDIYKGKMDLRTIAVMMFQGDIPEGVLPEEEVKEVISEETEALTEKVEKEAPLRRAQEGIARKRLERAYSKYGDSISRYDITPREAAQRTLGVLVPEGETYSPLSVLEMTTRYIKELMSVPDDAWITEIPGAKKPLLCSFMLKVNSILWNPNNLSLNDRKKHIQSRYNKARKYITKGSNLIVDCL